MMFQDFDLKTTRLLLLFLLCLFAWWLLGGSVTASASEMPDPQTVTVEVAELNRLDSIFSQLSQRNGKLQNELTDSNTELIKSKEALKRAQQELMQLRIQIAALKSLSVNQENLLQKANKSFEEYAAEQKKERMKIKAQRNAWAVAAIATCVICIIK